MIETKVASTSVWLEFYEPDKVVEETIAQLEEVLPSARSLAASVIEEVIRRLELYDDPDYWMVQWRKNR